MWKTLIDAAACLNFLQFCFERFDPETAAARPALQTVQVRTVNEMHRASNAP